MGESVVLGEGGREGERERMRSMEVSTYLVQQQPVDVLGAETRVDKSLCVYIYMRVYMCIYMCGLVENMHVCRKGRQAALLV